MAIQYTPQERSTLLNWVKLHDLDNPPRSLDDLKDGLILGQVLEQILPPASAFHRSSLISHPTTPADRRQNLDTIFRGLTQFMREDEEKVVTPPSPSQFRAIVDNLDDNNICEFVFFILSAATMTSLAKEHLGKISRLPNKDIATIKSIVMERQGEDRKTAEDVEESVTERDMEAAPTGVDSELAQEAALTKAQKEALEWKQRAGLAETRIERLLGSNDDLKARLEALQIKNDNQSTDDPNMLMSVIQSLEAEKREKISEIDRLEALLEDRETKANSFEKKNVTLSATASRVPDLDDKVKELSHVNTELQSQVRVLEKYRSKAQSAAEIQRNYQNANNRILEMEAELIEKEQIALKFENAQRTNGELRRTIETLETQLNDEGVRRAALQDRANTLEREREMLEQYRGLAEARVKELEDLHLGGYSPQRSGSPDAGTGANFNLEEELQTTTDPATAAMRLELSKLRAENMLLRNNMGVAADNERLHADLDVANQKVDHLRQQHQDVSIQHGLAMAQLNALLSEVPKERYVEKAAMLLKMLGPFALLTPEYYRDEAWARMSSNLHSTTQDLERVRSQLLQMEAAKADKERDLQAAQTDRMLLKYISRRGLTREMADDLGLVNAVDQDAINALEVLKSSDQLISASLKSELDATRKRLDAVTTQFEEKRDEAHETLKTEVKLRQQIDDLNGKLAANGLPTTAPPPPEDAQKLPKKDDGDKNEKLRAALRAKIQVRSFFDRVLGLNAPDSTKPRAGMPRHIQLMRGYRLSEEGQPP